MDTRYRFFLRRDDGELISQFDSSPWSVGEWRETPGEGPLCGNGWLHAYDSAELAEFHDTIHAEYGSGAELWRVECDGAELRDGAMKCGWSRMRPLERVERVLPTPEQYVRYAIFCVMAVLPDEPWAIKWRRWADDWISGRDRSTAAAGAVSAGAATSPVGWSQAAWAARAASLMVGSSAAAAALWAADAAKRAVAAGSGDIDLAAIARQAMEK